jgi:hypothetical protein
MLPLLLVVLAALAQPAPGPAPTITAFTPDNTPAAVATSVRISGTNFVNGATVKFGASAAASVNVIDAQTIVAVTAPQPGFASVKITVTNPDGQSATSAGFFTFTNANPVITGISPDSGSTAGGYEVTIAGFNFHDGVLVQLLSGPTSFRQLDDVRVEGTTRIIGTAPIGPADFEGSVAANVLIVNVNGRSASVQSGFTWIQPPLAIHLVSPASGPAAGGTKVTIAGEGFSTAAPPAVQFGGIPATSVNVIDAVTLEVIAPASQRGGSVSIFMRNDAGTVEKKDAFFYEGGVLPRRRVLRP